jgi:hypothetical protein
MAALTGEVVLARIAPDLGVWGWRRRARAKKMVKQVDRVRDVHYPVVVRINGIEAADSCTTQEEVLGSSRSGVGQDYAPNSL